MHNEERFKYVLGYQVGEFGTILGLNGRPIALRPTDNGYRSVHRFNNRRVAVHRLVAIAWCNPIAGYHVDHINGNKLDNRASNLEWVSPGENTRRMHKSGRGNYDKPAGFGAGIKNSMCKAVICDGIEYPYQAAAAKALGVTIQAISYRVRSKNFPGYKLKEQSNG